MQRNKLKAVVLTTFHPAEYNIVRSYLLACQEVISSQGNVYDRGTFSTSEITWDVLLGQIGTGNIESAIEVERAINSFHPDIILSIGLACGFKNVQVGDVLAVTKAYSYECGKEMEGGFKTRPEANQSTSRMIYRARAEARNTDWQKMLPIISAESMTSKVFVGPLAAGEKEIASSPRFWQFLEDHYNDTLAIDTSSSGFLGATHSTAHIEALIIRGIVDTFSDSCSNASVQKAAYHASAFAFTVLSKLNVSQFLQYEEQQTNPLLQLEQLAYGDASIISSSNDNRDMTLYPAASVASLPSMSETSKKAQELFNKGNQQFQQRAYKIAIKSYNDSIRMDKSNSAVYNNKGMAHFHLGDYTKALEAYALAININPNYAEAYSNQAAVHLKLGDYRKAQASYQQAADLYEYVIAQELDETQKNMLQKRLASALTGLGDALYKLGDYREARRRYNGAIDLEPSKASAYIGRGDCRVQQGYFKEALAEYKQAIKYDPNNPAVHKGRGDAYQGLKQWKKALEAYAQSLLLKPNDAAEIYLLKGMAHLRLEEYQQALEAFREYHRLSPDNIFSYKCLIATLGKLQLYEEVLKICMEANQRFPGDEWISARQQRAHLEMAELYQRIEEQVTTILPVIHMPDFAHDNNKQTAMPSKEEALPQILRETMKAKDKAGARRKVFVSYNHNDAKWLERLRVHLAPMEREGIIDLWDDTKIAIGASWQTSIREALETARVAITLVSADFLASEFIVQQELPRLLSRAASDGLIVMPVIVSPCLFTNSALGSFQAANDPNKPLSGMASVEREKALVNLAKVIREYLTKM